MFNDRYGLTKAVLKGRKTQTRRLALHVEDTQSFNLFLEDKSIRDYVIHRHSRFRKNEIVAVAQCLKDLGYDAKDTSNGHIWGLDHEPAWTNKMFVSASQCKSWIRITDIRLERLQDITNADCFAEGVARWTDEKEYNSSESVHKSINEMEAAGYETFAIPGCWGCYTSPKEAYAALIDKVSGKGTWDKNPWVFVYDFVLYQGIK